MVSVTVFCLGHVGRWLCQDRDESRANDVVGTGATGGFSSYDVVERRGRRDTVDDAPSIWTPAVHRPG